jgi:hypothetical protein
VVSFNVLSYNLPGGTEESNEPPNSRTPRRYLYFRHKQSAAVDSDFYVSRYPLYDVNFMSRAP